MLEKHQRYAAIINNITNLVENMIVVNVDDPFIVEGCRTQIYEPGTPIGYGWLWNEKTDTYEETRDVMLARLAAEAEARRDAEDRAAFEEWDRKRNPEKYKLLDAQREKEESGQGEFKF